MDDLDLTPTEVREARRRRRTLIWLVPLILAIASAILFSVRPASQAVKAWQARRWSRAAFALIEQARWDEATAKARGAYQLSPDEPEAWRAIARLATRSGHGSLALEWWRKIEGTHRLTLQDRRDYTAAALMADDLVCAETQITILLSERAPSAGDLLLNAQLAMRRGDINTALENVQQTLSWNDLQSREIFDGAVIVFALAPANSTTYASAWDRTARLADDPRNPLALEALMLLARQTRPSPATVSGDTISLSIAPPPPAPLLPEEIAARLESHPKSRPYHLIMALELRARQQPARESEYIAQGVERFAKGGDDALAALARWLQSRRQYETALKVLPLERALHRRDLFLQHLDALSMLAKWNEVAQILRSERFPLDAVSHHMYLAFARTYLGESTAASNEWQRALEASDTPDKCLMLGSYAERGGVSKIAAASYLRALQFSPNNRPAYLGRLRALQASGETAQAESVAAEIVKRWPGDEATRQEQNYLKLLLGAVPGDVEAIERDAETVALREIANWNARATMALARLRSGRNFAAMEAFAQAPTPASLSPRARAIHAAVLAANGWKEAADAEARTLTAAQLLPEERALIAALLHDEKQPDKEESSRK